MKRLKRAAIVSVFLSILVYAPWTQPAVWSSVSHPVLIVAQAQITAQEAAAMVQAQTGGQILAVKTTRSDGRIVYRVKVLTPDGEVRIFYVDAETGAM